METKKKKDAGNNTSQEELIESETLRVERPIVVPEEEVDSLAEEKESFSEEVLEKKRAGGLQ